MSIDQQIFRWHAFRDGRHTPGPSHRFGGPWRGTTVGPREISSYILASARPLRYLRSLPHTCHQKFSKRRAVGSLSFLFVVV